MVKVTTSPSGLSPVTAVGSPRARIDSANSADSADTSTMAAMDATADKARSIQFDDEALRGHRSEEDEEEKPEFGDVKTTADLLGEVEELSLQVSQMGQAARRRHCAVAEGHGLPMQRSTQQPDTR
ncbi:unnamed protein product [Phytophthora fragariaefolia]|uniref:Unnamed protein product n=1 Tax=Phytophthora fragariaefolia TaxID=1490495 RepID=A0A9W7CX24_9STRA|nr:unnamed protein product [Phytophthora fragariaefolia]